MKFATALDELFRCCNSYTRLPRLLDMWNEGQLRPKTFFRLLGEIWQSCDNIGPFSEELYEVIFDYEGSVAHDLPAIRKQLIYYESMNLLVDC